MNYIYVIYAYIFLEDNGDLQYITDNVFIIIYYMYGRSNGKVAFKVSELKGNRHDWWSLFTISFYPKFYTSAEWSHL